MNILKAIGINLKILGFQKYKVTTDKFRQVLEQAPGAVYIIDKQMRFEYINPFFTILSGYTKDELLGKNITDTLYKGKVPESRKDVMETLGKGERWQGELLTYHKNGTPYWANTIASPYKNEKGQIESYIIIQQDITENKNMEKALHESENLYRNLIENTLDSVVLTQDYKFVYYNQVFLDALGYTHEELQNIEPTTILAPEDRERVINYHRQRMSGEVMTQNYKAFFVRKNGSRFLAEMNASYITYKGKPASFLTMRDITDRERMQNELEQSVHRFRDLAEMLPQTVYELDREGRQTYMNKAGLIAFGHKDNAIGHFAYNSIAPEDHDRMRENMIKSLQKDKDYTIGNEYTAVRKDGSRFPVIVYAAPIVVKDEVIGTRGIIIDISERKSMENALRENEIKYKTLVENSHDGIIIVRDNRILFANDTFCHMMKYPCAHLYTLPATHFIHPDDRLRASVLSVQRQSGDFSTITDQYRLVTSTGEIIECETLSTMIDYRGEKASFFTMHNITESKKMERELRESEEKYRMLFQAESDAIFMIDVENGQILDVNPAATEIYGYSREEFLKMKNTDVSAEPAETAAATKRNDTKVLLRYHRKKDNSIFPVELSAGFTTFRNRKVQIVTSRDITENKKMQDAIRISEKKYRELAELLPQSVYELDLNGNLTYVNRTACETFGIDESDYGTSASRFIAPEYRISLMENIEKTLTKGISTYGSTYVALRKNGSTFPAMTFASPIFDNEKIIGVRGMMLDMTEHEAMQKALRESEEKYRTLIEKATDGIIITQDGYIKFANPAMSEMLKYTTEEFVGQPYMKFASPEDHQTMIDFHKRRMAGEYFTSVYRSRLLQKDGNLITAELNARTFDYNGKPAAFIIIRNITDRLNIENELQIAKEELERLNHDLEARVIESSKKLSETHTQLINLQKENLQSQFEVLRQQVNPHFLFNSLNVLTSLIKLEPDLAEKFSEHLSKVYRYVLENKDNEWVDLHTELRFLDAYIFLLNIRFVDKIHVKIDIPEEKKTNLIIPLAMQLLIENAIKHNIMTKSEPLKIDIFIDDENYLNIVNNLQERPSQLISTGVGLKNIQNRYLLLNNTSPEFTKTETHFIAKVPLVINEN